MCKPSPSNPASPKKFGLLALAVFFSLCLSSLATLKPITDEEKAQDLYDRAQALIVNGRLGEAVNKLDIIVDHYRTSPLAPKAQLEIARLYDDNRENARAFDAYQLLFDHFQATDLYTEALERQMALAMRVMETYELRERKGTEARTEPLPKKHLASRMFEIIVMNGPFAKTAPEAQFQHAVALEKEEKPRTARGQHQIFLDRYPDHHLADDAAFQIAYIDYKLFTQGNEEANLRNRAQLELEYMLQAYPESEKVPQGRALLRKLDLSEFAGMIDTARDYEDRDRPQSALKYYQQMEKQFPADFENHPNMVARLKLLRTLYPDVPAEPPPLPTSPRS
ncbi:MAG: tetratricopeptide repeat protein [Verrucomicrobiota bacterium]